MKLKAKIIRRIFDEKASIFFFFLCCFISQLGFGWMREDRKEV
jgi:hypothetical protein